MSGGRYISTHLVLRAEDPFELELARALAMLRRGRTKEFFVRMARARLVGLGNAAAMARAINAFCDYVPPADGPARAAAAAEPLVPEVVAVDAPPPAEPERVPSPSRKVSSGLFN